MTTGNIIRNGLKTTGGDCGAVTYGRYFSKGWSGGDSPNDHSQENTYSMNLLHTYSPLVSYKYPQDPDYHRDCVVPGFTDATFVEMNANDELSAINKCAEAVRGSSFNAAVAFAEGGKTLQMIGDRAKGLGLALQAFRRGDYNRTAQHLGIKTPPRRTPRKRSETASNRSFLEFEYGWRPFVNDIYEGAQYVFSKTNKPISKTYKGHVFKADPRYMYSDALRYQVGTARSDVWIRARIREDWNVQDELGLTDPMTVAWELVPYSFVADWVIPVGKYLAARHFLATINSNVWMTKKQTIDLATNVVNKSMGVYASDVRTYMRVALTRSSIVGGGGVPLPSVKRFSEMAEWRHAVDGVALLIGAGAFNKRS